MSQAPAILPLYRMISDTDTIFCITTYCILKITCYSGKGIKEPNGEKWLGENLVKGLEMFAVVCCAGKDPSH